MPSDTDTIATDTTDTTDTTVYYASWEYPGSQSGIEDATPIDGARPDLAEWVGGALGYRHRAPSEIVEQIRALRPGQHGRYHLRAMRGSLILRAARA